MNACYHPARSGRTGEKEEAAPVPGKGLSLPTSTATPCRGHSCCHLQAASDPLRQDGSIFSVSQVAQDAQRSWVAHPAVPK